MSQTLLTDFKGHKSPSPEGEAFLAQLEKNIAQDLWKSAGGHWSETSIIKFRARSMKGLAENLQGDKHADYSQAWSRTVREFHQNYWGEQRLLRKEKKEKTEEQKIFWELFSYIWMLLQAALITKTAVFYFGIKSAEEDTTEGKVYVLLAILFSFGSLMFFAYRKTKKERKEESTKES